MSADLWQVHDPEKDNTKAFESRSAAEDAEENMADLGVDVEVYPPGESPGKMPEDPGSEVEPSGEVVETTPVEPDAAPQPTTADEAASLPDRNVTDDPLTWMPSDFIDQIDGTPAINRKGFEVLSHFYRVGVSVDLEVPPEETDHEYARVKATATTREGRECQAFGSAHVDRGDDADLLLEMADTRARKRALSIATGVGAVAVEELRAAENGGE